MKVGENKIVEGDPSTPPHLKMLHLNATWYDTRERRRGIREATRNHAQIPALYKERRKFMKFGRNRRQFLTRTMGSFGGMITARLGWLFPEARPASAMQPDSHAAIPQQWLDVPGERYAGFVLLPEGARLPADVQDYRHGIPSGCGAGNQGDQATVHAIQTDLESPAEVFRQGGFPLYTLGALPAWLQPAGNSLVRHGTGELFGGWTLFKSYSRALGGWYTSVSILAQVDFPRPVPLWSSSAVEPDGPSVTLEKVDFLPAPGVMIRTYAGFVLHWIHQDIYYILTADRPSAYDQADRAPAAALRAEARALGSRLTLVG
jgi:hypothetical protein